MNVLSGIFDTANTANPFKDWNMVYIPYCTGDVHFGTKSGTPPGMPAAQQFMGYRNMQKFIGRVVPTFKDKVNRVVMTGVSAGSFGAALNYSMVQDAFGSVKVDALLDSGAPFSDQYMPICMQKRWRELWGLNDALPPDCTECKRDDGGGFIKMADFLIKKHPNATLAVVTSIQDEVIRLFFSVGLQNCANYDTADPVAITLGQLDPNVYYPAAELRSRNERSARNVQILGALCDLLLGWPKRHPAPAHLSRSFHRPGCGFCDHRQVHDRLVERAVHAHRSLSGATKRVRS